MSNLFFEQPIPNSPYVRPGRHWELDGQGQPTQNVMGDRRKAEFITPIPKSRKQSGGAKTKEIVFDDEYGLSTAEQQYETTSIINEVRGQVERWRSWPKPSEGGHPGNRPIAPALAAPPVRGREAVLLPSRGGRDRHLAG